MRSFVISFIFFTALSVSGQDWTVVVDKWHFDTELGKEPVSARDVYEKIAGTPFLNDDFETGSLITRDSILYPNVPLRYNIFKDEMEFLTGDGSLRVISSPRNFSYFIIGDRTFVYLAYRDGNEPRLGYFELLNRGECRVVMRRRTDYAEPEGARGFDAAKPPRFVSKRDSYYLLFGRQVPVEVRLNRRSILSLFDERSGEIARWVANNNLSYRDPDDLVKMAGYYNRLITDE